MKWFIVSTLLLWTARLAVGTLDPVCWTLGAPQSACVSMSPIPWSHPADPPSPWNIAVDNINPANRVVTVTIAGSPGANYRSILLQARRPGSDEPLGTFLEPPQGSGLKLMTCSAADDSVTNRLFPRYKGDVTLTWQAPGVGYLGNIYFVATIIEDCIPQVYWVDIQSESLDGVLSALPSDVFWPGSTPDGYFWASASASYQVEGAWNVDGKGESMWDWWAHLNGLYAGDDACKSYFYYARDVEMTGELGLKAYRFSISWTRILPNGSLSGGINQPGIDYYNNLINGLIANGKTPYISLYHWDGSQALQDAYGGWLSENIVSDFNDYARVCFQAFGDRVKYWATFNEPWSFVVSGYGIAGAPPGIWDAQKTEMYKAAHNVIKAHARAWHTYDDEFRATQQGQVGIVIGALWSKPQDENNPGDVEGARLYQEFFLGWFANPIFGNGDYPQDMKDIIAYNSAQEGWPESRLPTFTADEIANNRGTADFVGLNQYSARLIYASNDTSPVDPDTGWFNWMSIMIPDLYGYRENINLDWPQGEMIFLFVTPWCVREQLDYFKATYQHQVPFYLTESGISEAEFDPPKYDDIWRTCYYYLYTDEIVKAIQLDGTDHRGFFAWTMMDNVEWGAQTSERFGLYYTNFSDPARTRTPKDSVASYRDITTNGGFPLGASHTEHAQQIWDWCQTHAPYVGTRPDHAATFNAQTRTRQTDPTVDYALPGVRVGAQYRDKVLKNNP